MMRRSLDYARYDKTLGFRDCWWCGKGKTEMFGAVKGCLGMAGLGAWAPRPRGTHTGLWCPLGFFLQGGDRVATAVSVGCDLRIWSQAL